MAFDLVVWGCAPRTLCEALGDLVSEDSVRIDGDMLIVEVEDQSALVAVLARVNDVGVRIDRVRKVQ